MKALLDTNIIIDHLRKKQEAKELLQRLLIEGATFYCCDIVVTEVIAGMRASEEKETRDFFNDLEYMPTAYPAAYQAGKIKYSLSRKGVTISTTDALIAAVAKSHDLSLITNNRKDFQSIENLKIVSI